MWMLREYLFYQLFLKFPLEVVSRARQRACFFNFCIFEFFRAGLQKNPAKTQNSGSGPGSEFKIKFFSGSKISGPDCPARYRAVVVRS